VPGLTLVELYPRSSDSLVRVIPAIPASLILPKNGYSLNVLALGRERRRVTEVCPERPSPPPGIHLGSLTWANVPNCSHIFRLYP
jgi:hypothetical protein